MAAADASFRSDTTFSPVAQVGDNFDVFAPPLVPPEACSVAERGEGSDTESGSAYRRRRRRRIEGVGRGGGRQVKRRKTRRKHEGGCACDEEEEIVNTNLDRASEQVRGRAGKRQPEEAAEERRDTREEDRAFWEMCLAYGYP